MNDSPNSRGQVSDLEQDIDLGQDISITESSTEAQNDSARLVPSCTNQLHADNSGSKSAGKIVLPTLPDQSLSELDNFIRTIQNAIGTRHFNIGAVRTASDTFPQNF